MLSSITGYEKGCETQHLSLTNPLASCTSITRCTSPSRGHSHSSHPTCSLPPHVLRFASGPVRRQINIVHGNVLDVEVDEATAVFVYLVPDGMAALKDGLVFLLRTGVRVVTYGESLVVSKACTAGRSSVGWTRADRLPHFPRTFFERSRPQQSDAA